MRSKYKEIIRNLTAHSFPLLKNKKIFVFTFKLSFYAFSVWIPPFLRLIVISKKAKDFDEPVIKGLLAHELCHQERYINMGISRYILFAVRFITSRKTRSSEEKATDRLTIEKGYGRELYKLSEITHNERKNKNTNELYLSLEEIKSYSERLGRW